MPYSNQAWVARPLGFTVPFRVALVPSMDVASTDVVMGVELGLLAQLLKTNTYGAGSLAVVTDFTFASTVTV